MVDEIRSHDAHEENQGSANQKRDRMVEFDEKFKKFQETLEKKQSEKEQRPEKEQQPKKRENTNIYRIPPDIRKNSDDFYAPRMVSFGPYHHDHAPCKPTEIPPDIRKNSDDFYAPRMVSFGPYHHDHPPCKPTEDIKELVVFHSLITSKKTINNYVEALSEVLKSLKDKYDQLDPKWKQDDDDSFLWLMIYDGCFLLEVLRAANDNSWDSPVWNIDEVSRDKLMEGYRHDMLLLENQLPMLVLEKLRDVQNNVSVTHSPPESLLAVQTDKAKRFIRETMQKLDPQENLNRDILKFVFPRANVKLTKKCFHVLDLYRHSLLTQELGPESRFQRCLRQIMDSSAMRYIRGFSILILLFLFAPFIWVILALADITFFPLQLLTYIFRTQPATGFHFNIPSITDLNEVGIGLMGNMKSLRDISFEHRILRLPQISVDDSTESIFLNLIAFEKLHKNVQKEVTSYIYFMSSLIKCPDDVRHLQRCGVIDSRLRTHGDIDVLFNSLIKDINVHDPDSTIVLRYRKASEMLINGFRKMNKPWRKDLWQIYLRSPWAFVSILAAFLLYALTAVQTAYTILSYYNSK